MADLTTITNTPVPAPARLPALEAPELSVAYLAKMKEIIEVMLGRRGSDWDRAVTFRDLQNGGLGAFIPGGSVAQGSPAIFDPGTGTITVGGGSPVNIDAALRNSAAYKALMARIGSAEELANLPDVISSQISTALADLARERKADIRTVENKIQTNEISMASRLTEITAALEGATAGVREFDAAYADTMRAVAVRVEQVAAALDTAGGGVIAQELLEATADAVEGLKAQWSLKIQTVPTNGQPPVIAGIALSVEDPIAGPGTSALVFMAESFGFFTNNGTLLPFSIVGDQITFNGNVLINGTLMFGEDGKLLLAAAPAGTLNSNIKIGGRNLYKKATAIAAVVGAAQVAARTATGFELRGVNSNDAVIRMAGIIPSNGEFTISFDLSTQTNNIVPLLLIDVCDSVTWSVAPAASTTAQHYSKTFTVSNWSADVYNFIDFNNLSGQSYYFTNFNVQAGNKELAYTPAPEDVAADAQAKADAAQAAAALDATNKSAAGSEAAAALPGINLAVAAKLNKNTDDVLGARLLLSGNGKVQLGTDTDGTTIAPAGIIGKKAGVVNYSQSTTGAVIAREFDAIGPDGEVIFSTSKTLADQTRANPNMVESIPAWAKAGVAWVYNDTNTASTDGYHMVFRGAPEVGSGVLSLFQTRPLKLEANTKYTLSFKADAGAQSSLSVDLYNNGISGLPGTVFTISGSGKVYRVTWTTGTQAELASCVLRLFAVSPAAQILVYDVKFERGDTVTAWCDTIITKFNATTFIQSGAFERLAAFVAFFGSIELGVDGALWAGQTAYDTGTGMRLGTDSNGDPYFSMRSANGKYVRFRPSTNTFETSGQKLVNPDVEGLILPPFTASLSGGAMTSTGANGTRSLGSRQITGSGGLLPYRSFSWTVTVLEGTGATYTLISGENTDTVSVTATGTNATARARITGTIIDANGISASASFTTNASFGAV